VLTLTVAPLVPGPAVEDGCAARLEPRLSLGVRAPGGGLTLDFGQESAGGVRGGDGDAGGAEERMRARRTAGRAAAAEVAKYPVRMYIAALLFDRPMTANELAAATEMSVSTVRRHLRAMRNAHAVEITETHKRRGTAEQVYGPTGPFLLDQDEYSRLTPKQRRQIGGYILKASLTEATRSLVSNPSKRSLERDDVCFARTPIQVDEEGWAELAKIHSDALQRVIELRERVEDRIGESDAETFRATSVILWFEASSPSR
jgi:DNA-binding transcriptional ArsR family regulator